jgi:hypothetical protein
MSAGMIFVLWKGVLAFGLPVAFGFWELYQLRKERLKDEARAAPILSARNTRPEPLTSFAERSAARGSPQGPARAKARSAPGRQRRVVE